ncbi:MAG: hypothetical protein ACAI43_11805 [Phycisphaerae bacterium]|nr:hypothetical protein [Tepidisphaeraceae bacterium]
MKNPFRLPDLTPAAEAAVSESTAGARRFWRERACQCATCHDARLAKIAARSTDTTAAAAEAAAAPAPTAAVTPVGALLARHILRDGEIVLLTLKPSLWFVLLSSLKFVGVVLIVMLGAIAWEGTRTREWFYVEAAIFLITGRLMWAVLQWMGRLYVLTDLRIIRLSGVFRIDIFDCALRKVARTAVIISARERACLCDTGTIEITPEDETCPPALWQTVKRPHHVNEIVRSAIAKSRHHGLGAVA